MVFFAKDKEHARLHLKKLKIGQDKKYYSKYSDVKLAKRQIPHVSKWKTWTYVSKK